MCNFDRVEKVQISYVIFLMNLGYWKDQYHMRNTNKEEQLPSCISLKDWLAYSHKDFDWQDIPNMVWLLHFEEKI